MELIRWIRQQAKKIKNCWILTKIQEVMVCEEPLKKSEAHKKQIEKKQYYREPDLKKWKNFRRE